MEPDPDLRIGYREAEGRGYETHTSHSLRRLDIYGILGFGSPSFTSSSLLIYFFLHLPAAKDSGRLPRLDVSECAFWGCVMVRFMHVMYVSRFTNQ